MNKFSTQIASTDSSIKKRRAELLSNSAEQAQLALINDLKTRITNIELRKEKHTDLAVTNSTSLTPGKENFEPSSWVEDLHRMNIDLLTLSVELESAKKTYDEWFSEIKAEKES